MNDFRVAPFPYRIWACLEYATSLLLSTHPKHASLPSAARRNDLSLTSLQSSATAVQMSWQSLWVAIIVWSMVQLEPSGWQSSKIFWRNRSQCCCKKKQMLSRKIISSLNQRKQKTKTQLYTVSKMLVDRRADTGQVSFCFFISYVIHLKEIESVNV